jgi:RHS repeat-associated protein
LKFRYADPDNYYAVRLGKDTGGGSGPIELLSVVRGKEAVVASSTYSTASSVTLKVRVDANDDVEVWLGGSSKIVDTNGLDVAAGNVALAGEKAIFDNVKVGYDTGSDDVIDDYVVNETFGGTDITPTYDDNGNLTFDGSFKYTYDAWNRLVKATLDDTDVTIHEAAFDGLGRRVVKTVSNSGDLDGVTEYYHHGNQIIETRGGSGNLETQVYHGTQYIDEVVGQRIANMGRVYVHQDANYNVTGTTDLTARQIERNYYSPYGQLEVAVDSHPFDYDDDGDVDQDDYAVTTNGTCSGTAAGDCRRMDADADGDVDSADQTAISNYIATLTSDTELTRIPAATESKLGNALGHQGLVFDAELTSYQNRARQYAPAARRFMQRDSYMLRIYSDRAAPGYIDGMNLYNYTRESPFGRLDPSGHWSGSYTCNFVNGGCTCGLFWIFCYQSCGRNCTLIACDSPPCPPTTTDTWELFQCGGCGGCNPPPGGGNPGTYGCDLGSAGQTRCVPEG